ncbi:hypothetical protein V9K99_03070 [Kribbella sp. CCNWLW201]
MALGVLAITVGYFTYDENRLLEGASTGSAVVTDVVRLTKGRPYIEVEIALSDGRVVKTTTEYFSDSPTPRKGDRIEVEYVIDGRDVYARQVGLGPDLAGQWGWTAAGGVSALVGGVLLVRRRWGAVGDE